MNGDAVGIGGEPQVMPTNNWWSDVVGVVGKISDTAFKVKQQQLSFRDQELQQAARREEQAQRLRNPTLAQTGNRPPGTQGVNAQASSVAGGKPQAPGNAASALFGVPAGWLLLGAAAIVLVMMVAKR